MASRFVETRRAQSGSPAPAQAPRPFVADRIHAQHLKVSRSGTKSTSVPVPPVENAQSHASKPLTNTNLNSQTRFVGSPDHRRGLEFSDVASDFDQTLHSDIDVRETAEQYDNGHGDDMEMRPNAPYSVSFPTNPEHIQQHIQQRNQSKFPAINGSLESEHVAPQQQLNLPSRTVNSHPPAHVPQTSKKRSRSGEGNVPAHTSVEEHASHMGQMADMIPGEIAGFDEDEEYQSEEEHMKTPSGSPRKNRQASTFTSSQEVEVESQPAVQQLAAVPQYSDSELKKKSLAGLQNESWEHERVSTFVLDRPFKETSPLDDKMEHYVMMKEQDQQVQFFQQLSNKEWEESGDWFVARFQGIMTKMRDNIKARRKVAEKYEERIAAREKMVRGKSDSLEREFRTMRAGGEDILKSKKI